MQLSASCVAYTFKSAIRRDATPSPRKPCSRNRINGWPDGTRHGEQRVEIAVKRNDNSPFFESPSEYFRVSCRMHPDFTYMHAISSSVTKHFGGVCSDTLIEYQSNERLYGVRFRKLPRTAEEGSAAYAFRSNFTGSHSQIFRSK